LDPLYENVKEEIFGEIINKHKPPKPKREPALSTMKKEDLVAECRRLGIDEGGKVADMKARIKAAREEVSKVNIENQESVEDLFKNYELSTSKDESS
jgi:DNA polymerase delta subunit 1